MRMIKMLGWIAVSLYGLSSLSGAVRVVATTTHVADLLAQVGGPAIHVEALMGPGVDPHLYKPSAPDVSKVNRAEALFYHGLNLEGAMGELFARMARRGKIVVAVTENISAESLLPSEDYEGHYDPHVWFDPTLWAQAVDRVVGALSALIPAESIAFAERGQRLKEDMTRLDAWAMEQVQSLPESRRILVTSHDAFRYLGRRYGIEVVGIQGISTAVEAGLADISAMVQWVRDRQLPAIFVESSVSTAAIDRVARDAGVTIGGILYSDSLGRPGTLVQGAGQDAWDEGQWQGTFVANIWTFVSAMQSLAGE